MPTKEEIEESLARARRTVAESRALIEAVELRRQETDRMLAKQGLTREALQAMKFTAEQEALVAEELRRRGMPPLVSEDELKAMADQVAESRARVLGDGEDTGAAALENRTRKFGSMMQAYRL